MLVFLQMKADVSMKCVKKELECAIGSTTKLEKLVTECEFQRDYLQNKLNIENADRMQLVKEMQTVGSTVEILNNKLTAQEILLGQYKSDLIDFVNATDKISNEYSLEDEAFKTQFELNEIELRKCKEELSVKQNQLEERNKITMTEKIALEQELDDLQKKINVAKMKNEELHKTEDSLEQERKESEKSLLELKAELDAIPLEELQKKLGEQQIENREKINRKMIELELLDQRFFKLIKN